MFSSSAFPQINNNSALLENSNMWAQVPPRRHSYGSPPRPLNIGESLFFGRSSSVSGGFAPLSLGNSGGSPNAGFTNISPIMTANVSPTRSSSIWNANYHGGNDEDDEFFLSSAMPVRAERRFSFETIAGSPTHKPRETSPRLETPLTQLFTYNETDETIDQANSDERFGAIGSNVALHAQPYGILAQKNKQKQRRSMSQDHPIGNSSILISPTNSRESLSLPLESENIIVRYFTVDELARNRKLNSEIMGVSFGTADRVLPRFVNGPPSPPIRPQDIDAGVDMSGLISVPSKRLFFVQFKCSRTDVFFLPESSTVAVAVGDYVIVDADRGKDLGRVVKANVTPEEAGYLKLKKYQEQQAILQHIPGSPDSEKSSSNNMPGVCSPKQILRLAQINETSQVIAKKTDEENSLQTCLQKVNDKKLNMSILDAEYQWDRRKLTFFYSADHRIDFRDLVRDLFRIYKTRIWMCAVGEGTFVPRRGHR